MAKIIMGIGASHTTLMNTQWDKVDHLPRAHHFKQALTEAGEALISAQPDAVVIVGSNHFRGYWLDMMPAFCIGVGAVLASGEHGTPAGAQCTDEATAVQLCNALLAQDFDLAFSTELAVDHGISHAIQWLLGAHQIPIIPLVINCFAPPLPGLKRCLALGTALRQAVAQLPDSMRVAVIATGGLSHALPFPDWRAPQSEDDHFLVDSWKHGRGRWAEYEERRRAIIVNAPPQINEDFDRMILERLQSGHLKDLPKQINDDQLVAMAGNGANEIRAWLIMAEAMNHKTGRVLCYSPMPEWLTGMAVALIKDH